MNKYQYLLGCMALWVASAVPTHADFPAAPFLFGFSGNVTFQHLEFPADITKAYVSGATYRDCEDNKTLKREAFFDDGYKEISEERCIQFAYESPKKKLIPDPEARISWPACVVGCPLLLDREVLQLIYPDRYKRVEQLVQQYGIAEYVHSVASLKTQYRVEEFEKAMFDLEREVIHTGD